ncbi:MAG: hypothetical protein KJ882_08770 [Proteobacteria bacterium]|nr:hypothetical protein [Desulfobacula sp.]MBU4010846.1 hypothetical protein [Pseudomonadota bacterium]
MKKSNVGQNFGKYPFIIHGDPLQESTAFPSHTHGLNDIGWPEFMIDPLAFGPHGNADRINEAYDYFKKSKKRKLLTKIMNGHTVEAPINKLHKKWKEAPNYKICFRLVPNTFEAVKLAYGTESGQVDPDLVVVQIYVKGDDFALMDAYYAGGVTW